MVVVEPSSAGGPSTFLRDFILFFLPYARFPTSDFIAERQLRLYGHVARLPAEDLFHQILSCRDPRDWTMPRGVRRLHG